VDDLGKNRIIALTVSVLLPILVAFGAQLGTRITSVILIIGIVCFVILTSLNKINARDYPIYLFSITLCMMWQTSMLGAHIIGSDMAGEFYSSNAIFNNGVWHPSADYGTQSSTSIVVGWVVPTLARLLHVDVVWIYKIILPIIFSCTLVVLYYAYKKQIGDKKAVFSCLFFMIVPIASLEVAQIGKMMVAELFFGMMVLLLVVKLKWYWQLICLIVVVVLSMLSHYTMGFAAIAYLGGILIIRLVTIVFKNWRLFKERIVPVWITVVVIAVTVSGCIAYYGMADGGSIMKVMKKVIPVYSVVAVETVGINIIPPESEKVNSETSTPEVILMVDKAIKNSNIPDDYLDKLNDQESLIKTAIGFDFKDASIAGKIFRVIQYLTQLMIIVGGIWLLFNFKKYKFTAEFFAGIIASFFLLGLCIFIPQFSLIINATRFYQIALFFLAPIFVISLDVISEGRWKWVLPSVMIAYFVFTSGLVYELMRSDVTNKLDVPYSASLSGQRTGIYASYTSDDVKAVKWIISQNDGCMVVADYNGGLLVSAYEGLDKIREKGKWYNLSFDNVPENTYVLLTSWNTESQLYLDSIKNVRGGAGLRVTKPLPDLKYAEVYRSGNTVVLKR
jgi:uncharacterized membrane protein